MTPRELLLARLRRLEDQLAPAMARAFTDAFRALGAGALTPGVLRALERGDVFGAVEAMLSSPAFVNAQRHLRTALANTFIEAGRRQATVRLAASLKRTPWALGDPAAIRELGRAVADLDRLTPFARGQMTGFIAALRANIAAGRSPLLAVEAAMPFIPLTAKDHALWMSYELDLRAGNLTRALRAGFRDPKLDEALRTLRASSRAVPEATIVRLRDAYAGNLTALRAETLARTATLNASRMADYAGWEQMGAAAGYAPDRMWKTWETNLDGRERQHHHDMHGVTVRFDQPWHVEVDGDVMVPGQNAYNCRCSFRVSTRRPSRLAA